jgi:hypothetical protein
MLQLIKRGDSMAKEVKMKTIKFPNSDVIYVVTDEGKIEKDQGVENAGKILGIGEDGMATLIDAETLETKIPENLLTYSEQTLTEEQQSQVRANIGAGTSNFSGSYNDLTDRPEVGESSYIVVREW